MFPRVAERRALPKMTAQYAESPGTQYWDDSKRLGIELKQRIVPAFKGDVVWDTFLLFGPEATWADAEDHLQVWGYPIVEQKEQLFATLSKLGVEQPAEEEVAADVAE